jgi:APA family basic amino acid/polyamine antiporter
MALKRVLGAGDAGLLVAGNMIGAGIFVTPGLVAAHLPGAVWQLAAWVAGGLLALAGAAVYAELGARIPRAGGDYQYLSRAFGQPWGFLTGWAGFTLTFSAATAVMAGVAIDHLQQALPGLFPGAEMARRGAAALLVLLLTMANVLGARTSGRATLLLTAVPLLGLGALFAYGLLAGSPVPRPAVTLWATPGESWPAAAGTAMLPIFFTYSGWNAAAYLAGEMREPGRNLPRGLLLGTALVTILYVTINLILIVSLPAALLSGSTTAGADAARRLLGSGASRLFSACVAAAVLGSANVTLMAGARVYYAMACDRLAPAALVRTNAAGVPHMALWAGGLWSALMALAGGVSRLIGWTTMAILLLSALAAASLFVLRNTQRDAAPFRCPGYPFTPALYIAATLAVAGASALSDPFGALRGTALIVIGVPVYLLFRRRRGPV